MKIIRLDQTPLESVARAAVQALHAGELVIYPTETVYGVGVDATNQTAVEKLLAYKSRREGKPLSIAVTDEVMAERYAELNDQARTLYAQFLPGPMTVVSTARLAALASGVASEFGTIGIRIPDHSVITQILQQLQLPVTATSANASGKKRPYTIDDILTNLSQKQKELIGLIIDAGTLPSNEPSVVIDTTLSTPVTLRERSQTAQTQKLASTNEQETRGIAGRLLLKKWSNIRNTGLVIGLNGPLGAGKTAFVKGIASFLGITDTVISPTYQYVQEYGYERHTTSGMLYHFDVWKIDDPRVAERLEIASYIGPKNIIIIEWISQIQSHIDKLVKTTHCSYMEIHIADDGATQRTLSVSEGTR